MVGIIVALVLELASAGAEASRCRPSKPPRCGSIYSCCGQLDANMEGEPRAYYWNGTSCVADKCCQCDSFHAVPDWPTLKECERAHRRCSRLPSNPSSGWYSFPPAQRQDRGASTMASPLMFVVVSTLAPQSWVGIAGTGDRTRTMDCTGGGLPWDVVARSLPNPALQSDGRVVASRPRAPAAEWQYR